VKKLLLSLCATLALAGFASADVWVYSPGDGWQVNAPLHVNARGAQGNPTGAMAVYVDDQLLWMQTLPAIDTYLNTSQGWHHVVVQAWDIYGNVSRSDMNVYVNGGASGSSAPAAQSAPAPAPSNATYSDIDQWGGWDSCSSCANRVFDGVFDSAPYDTSEWHSWPSIDGASQQFWIGGDTPFTNALWWRELQPKDWVSHYEYSFYLYLENPNAPQALEFDVNHVTGGLRYIFGTQCNYAAGNQWDVWDNANHHWVHTGRGCWFDPYSWHHVTWEFARWDGQAVFVAVTVDGWKQYLDWGFWQNGEGGSELNVAFQMDGNSWQQDYSVWLDKINLNVW